MTDAKINNLRRGDLILIDEDLDGVYERWMIVESIKDGTITCIQSNEGA